VPACAVPASLAYAFVRETQREGECTGGVVFVAEARGVAKVAKAAGIPRESLSRALSKRGNPRLSTLQAVTSALGLQLTVEPRL
jgi:probable addiction module antidote protein